MWKNVLISALFGMFSVEAVHVDPWLVLQPNVDVAWSLQEQFVILVGTNLSLKTR